VTAQISSSARRSVCSNRRGSWCTARRGPPRQPGHCPNRRTGRCRPAGRRCPGLDGLVRRRGRGRRGEVLRQRRRRDQGRSQRDLTRPRRVDRGRARRRLRRGPRRGTFRWEACGTPRELRRQIPGAALTGVDAVLPPPGSAPAGPVGVLRPGPFGARHPGGHRGRPHGRAGATRCRLRTGPIAWGATSPCVAGHIVWRRRWGAAPERASRPADRRPGPRFALEVDPMGTKLITRRPGARTL
jgi:hypothetical protein